MIRLTSISSWRGDWYDLAQRQHEPLQLRHVQRGGRPFPRDVGDEHAEPPGGQPEEVVVVPANLARGNAQRRHGEARDVERAPRQQRHLDDARDAQLFLEPLLLGRGLQQLLDAPGHLVERIRQLAELVVRVDVDPVREVPVPHALGAHEELVNRAGDRPRQREPHAERDDLDDQEQRGDDEQDEDRPLAERPGAEHDLLRARQLAVRLARA